jgi:hypothetical protein
MDMCPESSERPNHAKLERYLGEEDRYKEFLVKGPTEMPMSEQANDQGRQIQGQISVLSSDGKGSGDQGELYHIVNRFALIFQLQGNPDLKKVVSYFPNGLNPESQFLIPAAKAKVKGCVPVDMFSSQFDTRRRNSILGYTVVSALGCFKENNLWLV